jgi:serine/threonine protein kinase
MPTIGRYRLLAQLGAGGMADVYLAVMQGERGFNRLVVLKVPKSELKEDTGVVTMLLDEARLVARLNHPNVVHTYEVLREGDRDVIVMEYLDGYSLAEIVAAGAKAGKPMPLWMRLEIMVHAMTGLSYAHDAKDFDGTPLNLVHRDVSPHNVFFTFDGQVKLLDFGVAKAKTSTHKTESGAFKGKVRYMPAEQLLGVEVDHRSDIFAVGVILWEAAVGARMWKGKGDLEVLSAIMTGEIPMPKQVNPDVPDALEAICKKALATRKEDRYASCLELRGEVEAYLATVPEAKGLREVTRYVEGLFEEARAERQRLIELSMADFNPADKGIPFDQRAGLVLPRLLPNVPPSASETPPPLAPPSDREDSRMDASSWRSFPGARGRGMARFRGVLIAMALAVIGLFAVTYSVMHKPKETARQPETTLPPPALAATSPVPPVSKFTKLTLHVEPTTATVTIDDVHFSDHDRRSISVVQDGAVHAIRAEAKGFAPKTLSVTADADTKDLTLVLEKLRPGGKGAGRAAESNAGFLTFDSVPWTHVHSGNRDLGQTPLVRVPMSPGDHILTLENPEQKIRQSYTVTIRAHETTTRRLGLQ